MLTAVKKQTYIFILPRIGRFFDRQDAMAGSAGGWRGSPEDLGQREPLLCAQAPEVMDRAEVRCLSSPAVAHRSSVLLCPSACFQASV